jgi:hypothetical protein
MASDEQGRPDPDSDPDRCSSPVAGGRRARQAGVAVARGGRAGSRGCGAMGDGDAARREG